MSTSTSCYVIDLKKIDYTLFLRREVWRARVWGKGINQPVNFKGSSYDEALDRAKRWIDRHDATYVQPPPSRVEYTPNSGGEPHK